jgi:hypothetical protein
VRLLVQIYDYTVFISSLMLSVSLVVGFVLLLYPRNCFSLYKSCSGVYLLIVHIFNSLFTFITVSIISVLYGDTPYEMTTRIFVIFNIILMIVGVRVVIMRTHKLGIEAWIFLLYSLIFALISFYGFYTSHVVSLIIISFELLLLIITIKFTVQSNTPFFLNRYGLILTVFVLLRSLYSEIFLTMCVLIQE